MDPVADRPPAAAPPQVAAVPQAAVPGPFATAPWVVQAPGRRSPRRVTAAVAVLVIALGATVGAIAESGAASARSGIQPGSGADGAQIMTQSLWRVEPKDVILPPKLPREGTENYFRLGINPDESCAQLPERFQAVLVKAGCGHVLEATYLDSTETVVVTLGVIVTAGRAADRAALVPHWTADAYEQQYTMMPSVYPVPASQASSFHDAQRIAWKSSISSDGVYITFAVAGFADGRTGPSEEAFDLGNAPELQPDSPPVQTAEDLSDYLLTTITALEPDPSAGTS